jgi:hypothetical protein
MLALDLLMLGHDINGVQCDRKPGQQVSLIGWFMVDRKVAPRRMMGKGQDDFNRIESLIQWKKGNIVCPVVMVCHESRKNCWTVGSHIKQGPASGTRSMVTVNCARPILIPHSCIGALTYRKGTCNSVGGTSPSSIAGKISWPKSRLERSILELERRRIIEQRNILPVERLDDDGPHIK